MMVWRRGSFPPGTLKREWKGRVPEDGGAGIASLRVSWGGVAMEWGTLKAGQKKAAIACIY